MHELTYEAMNSRKFVYKLFEYKEDSSPLRKSVATLMLEYKEERKYNCSFFAENVIQKFPYLR